MALLNIHVTTGRVRQGGTMDGEQVLIRLSDLALKKPTYHVMLLGQSPAANKKGVLN